MKSILIMIDTDESVSDNEENDRILKQYKILLMFLILILMKILTDLKKTYLFCKLFQIILLYKFKKLIMKITNL